MSNALGPRTVFTWHQVGRKALQIAVVVFIVYAAAGTPWRNYKLAHNSARLVGLIHGDGWATLYGVNEKLLSAFGDSYDVSKQVLGMPWAGRIGGLDTADPLMVASHALKTGTFSLSLLLGLLLPLGVALLLGKFYCSHLCPARLLFEIGQLARRGLGRLGIDLPTSRSEARLGGWVLLGGLLATWGAGTTVWLLILPYAGMSAAIFLLVTTGATTALVVPVAGWLAVDMLAAPGLWCGNLCPTGWLLEQVGRLSLVKLRKVDNSACPTACDLCTQVCPYALQPQFEQHQPACDNCGACVAVCPQEKLARTLPTRAGGGGHVVAVAALSIGPLDSRAGESK